MGLCNRGMVLALTLAINTICTAAVQNASGLGDLFKATEKTKVRDGSSVTYTFSGTTADYFNYARLCMASDNTCSSCGAPYATYKESGAASGMAYATTVGGGTPHQVQAAAIQSYLTSNGYAAGTYYVGLYVQSTGLVCNSNQSYCSTSQDDNNDYLCMQAVSNGTTTTLTRMDNGNAVLSHNTTPYLYVLNGTGNTISVCPVSSMNTTDHTFTCSTSNNTMTNAVNLPKGIAFDPIFTNAYVVSQNSSSTASVSCSISSSNGGLTCSTISNSGTALSGSKGVAIDPSGLNAYIINSGNTLLKCPISGGALNCSAVTLTGVTLNGATGVAIDPTNAYAYVANTSATTGVAACDLNTGACTLGDLSQSAPTGVAINNTDNAIYVTTGTGSSVFVCTITGGTTLNCSNASASNVFHPQSVVLNPSGTLAHFANNGTGHANLTVCSADGSSPYSLSSCSVYTDTNGTFGTNLQGMAWGNIVGP